MARTYIDGDMIRVRRISGYYLCGLKYSDQQFFTFRAEVLNDSPKYNPGHIMIVTVNRDTYRWSQSLINDHDELFYISNASIGKVVWSKDIIDNGIPSAGKTGHMFIKGEHNG